MGLTHLKFLAISTIRCIRWIGVGRDASHVDRTSIFSTVLQKTDKSPEWSTPSRSLSLAFHRLCVDVKNHPLSGQIKISAG